MPQKKQTLRIIAGQYRGRRIQFPDSAQLRPTPDRIRETVFNWLAPSIEGAHCLDCFAGSGALGFEALSRGASSAVFIEQSRTAYEALKVNADTLGTTQANIIHGHCPEAIPPAASPTGQYDIIFLDPPFSDPIIATSCQWFTEHTLLAPKALVYIESPHTAERYQLPVHWQCLQAKHAGQVHYALYCSL